MAKRVLITDDEPHFRYSSQVALRKAGYEVVNAENGEEALALIRSVPVDLLVLDMNMPRMSGEAVFAILKSSGNPLPIVAISGFAEGALVEQLMKRGCCAFLEKPFTPDELVQTVDTVLMPSGRGPVAPSLQLPLAGELVRPDDGGRPGRGER